MAAMNDPLAAPARAAATERYVPGSGEARRHVLVVIVNNRPGVLNRVASLMRARNFNIESLAVGHTERPGISRMTITFRGDGFAVEQMGKQLYRIIDVLKVQDLPESGVVEHELALIKVRATNSTRAEVLKVVEMYKGRVLDVSADTLIVEHGGTEQEIDALVALLSGFGIRELVRTGTVAMSRGSGAIDIEAILRAGPEPVATQAGSPNGSEPGPVGESPAGETPHEEG
jgi:acetolactate synthase I/III small subunit